ncbi:MAG: lysine exporter LysO family protein [Paramuribaculum sp.]|nr:lysine exporter LysO family protein [Paramuribaculum sp.]
MIEIIAILVCGVLLGRLLCSVKGVRKFAEGMSYTVWILIFVLGYSVGADSYVMNNIPSLGVDALILAAFSTAGSILATILVRRYINKEKK